MWKKLFIKNGARSPLSHLLNMLIVALILCPVFLIIAHKQHYRWSVIWDYRSVFLKGWLMTILLSLASLVLSSLLGAMTSIAKRSRVLFVRYLATFYVELIRGTPLLVQILFFFYVFAAAINLSNRYIVGVITLSLFSGAYLAEIFRAGIQSISETQLESAKSIGLTRLQTYRFVILPQAFRVSLPSVAGQFASLIKDSSLLSIIGISEFTYSAQAVNSTTYSTLESFLPLAVGYLLLTLPISVYSKYLERRYSYET